MRINNKSHFRWVLPVALIAILTIAMMIYIAFVFAPATSEKIVPPKQSFTLEIPAQYDKLVIYFHGAGETVASIANDPQKRPIFDLLKSQGYVIAYSDAHGNNWGNPASVEDYNELYDNILSKYNFKHVVFLSQSMGGLDGLLAVSDKHIPVECWAGIYPAIDTEALDALGIHPSIRTAFPNGNMAASNPMKRSADSYNIPMLIWASTSDTLVPAVSNTQAFVQKVPHVKWIRTIGEHGNQSNFDGPTLAQFYADCLAD